MPTDFSDALRELKRFKRMHRLSWNGPNQFVEMQVPDANSLMTVPYLFLINTDGDRVPWVPSQGDLMAHDWAMADTPKHEYLPHQYRVVVEKAKLDGDIERLRVFMVGVPFSKLYAAEQDRLNYQLSCMTDFSKVLGERIEAFHDH